MTRWLTFICLATLPALAQAQPEKVETLQEATQEMRAQEVQAKALQVQQLDTHFADANHAYKTDDLKGAIALYESILKDKMSAATYYNLGNAYYRSDEMGRAILSYARALVLDPDNPDTLANLKLAQEAAEAKGPERVWSENYAQSLSVNAWTWIAVVGFWILLALIFLPALYGWRSPWRPLLVALSILAVAAGSIGLAGYHQLSREGVVLANDAPLQLAPTANSPAKIFLQAGATADVKRIHGEYVYIETPTGDAGWISSEVFGKIWQ